MSKTKKTKPASGFKGRVYTKAAQKRMIRENQDIVFDEAGRILANSAGH